MPPHTRGKSRGSTSMLSVDTIRSFSRAGSRQAVAIPDTQDLGRSPSSLSYCDPYNQSPAVSLHSAVPGRSTGETPITFGNNGLGDEQTSRRKSRPLSWLPFGKTVSTYQRSGSDRLRKLKDPSSTSLAKSTISSPVLTSTTNIKIAKSEGVHCGELTPQLFDRSTWDGKIGWVRTEDDDADTATKAREVAETVAIEHRDTAAVEKPSNKLSQVVKDRFRGHDRRQGQSSFSMLRLEHENDNDYGQKLARYKSETMNLCRNKIRTMKGLTSPHSRSYSTSVLAEASMPGARETGNEVPLLTHNHQSSAPNATYYDSGSLQLPIDYETSSQLDSLTRSLNSILDKGLDSDTTAMEYFKHKPFENNPTVANSQASNNSQDGFEIINKDEVPDALQLSNVMLAKSNANPEYNLVSHEPSVDEDDTGDSRKPAMTNINNAACTESNNGPGVKDAGPTKSDEAAGVKYPAFAKPDDGGGVEETASTKSNDDDGATGLSMHRDVELFVQGPDGVTLPQPSQPYPGQLQTSGEYPKPMQKAESSGFTLLHGDPQQPQGNEAKHEATGGKEKKSKSLTKSASQWFKKNKDKIKEKVKIKTSHEDEPPVSATGPNAVRRRRPPTASSPDVAKKRLGVFGYPQE